MEPLFLRETGNPQDLSHNIVEVGIKLGESIAEQVWRASAEQVVDLVVGQTAPEQTKLNLSVVHLLQRLAHLLERLELLLHKLKGKGPIPNGSTKQLHP